MVRTLQLEPLQYPFLRGAFFVDRRENAVQFRLVDPHLVPQPTTTCSRVEKSPSYMFHSAASRVCFKPIVQTRPLRGFSNLFSIAIALKPRLIASICSYGFVDPNNPNDCLYQPAELLPTDRLMGFKKQIVEQSGFGVKELFPLLLNRFPTQVGRATI